MQEEIEIWKDILGFNGLYQASDLGRIKSVSKEWMAGVNRKMTRTKKETILATRTINKYNSVRLRKDGKVAWYRVHRLVYEAFNGKTDLQIDHKKEGDRFNNRLDNLQVLTSRENVTKYYLTIKKTSKYTGVCLRKDSNRWQAQITLNGRTKFLGRFDSEEKASEAYQNALQELNNKK